MRAVLAAVALGASVVGAVEMREVSPAILAPKAGDRTEMWWKEGFPHRVQGAPWERVILAGDHAFVLNTETLEVPHFGKPGEAGLDALPAGELELELRVDGKRYRAVRGGKLTRFSGPRLVESGRFFQRGDVTSLRFLSEEGTWLPVEARFETAAWTDRLALVLAARPQAPEVEWKLVDLEIRFTANGRTVRHQTTWPKMGPEWGSVGLVFHPGTMKQAPEQSPLVVHAWSRGDGEKRPVAYDRVLGWHRVDLDGIEPIVPEGRSPNDSLERVKLIVANPTGEEEVVRLNFAKGMHGFRQRIGSAITGISAVLRDKDGNPTGIPVQLSKNWHRHQEGGVHSGAWFHGLTQFRLPARSKAELELTLAYGHWGGVAAASHAQLSLVGWGNNQLWEESALGAWGESICYEPENGQASCLITDVRPLMVLGMKSKEPWTWTNNVGGGDAFRMFDPSGERVFPSAVRTTRMRQGPCLTEVEYAGWIGKGIRYSVTPSLGRTDDLVRATYRLRMDVIEAVEFSRFVIFQVGADTYNMTAERKLAVGNVEGRVREWVAQWGGNEYKMEPQRMAGRMPWLSLHEGRPREGSKDEGIWADRGMVIRSWKARLGGKEAEPWFAERGLEQHHLKSSTLDLVPPPGVTRFQPGDFVEAVIEYLVLPQRADDYYGPNEALRRALAKDGGSWRMTRREAMGNDRKVVVHAGKLERIHPDVRVRAHQDRAQLTVEGGLGHVPVTFTGLSAYAGFVLAVDGQPIDQGVHGNDFWQCDYDSESCMWSQTFTLPLGPGLHELSFSSQP